MIRYVGPMSSVSISEGGRLQDVILFKGKDPGMQKGHPYTQTLLAEGWLVDDSGEGFFLTQAPSTAALSTKIYHLSNDWPGGVWLWDGKNDVHWADLPHTTGNTTGNPSIVATVSYVYLCGLAPADGAFTLWRRAVNATPEMGWDILALPSDLNPREYGMTPMMVDHTDTIHLLAENNHSYAHWTKPSNDEWTAINVLYSGGEGSASPRARLVWAGPCRTGLACVDSYRKTLKIFTPGYGWSDFGNLPSNLNECAPLGVFLINESEPWCFGEAGQTEGLPPYAKVWTPQSMTCLPGSGIQTDWGDGMPLVLPDATALFSSNVIPLSTVEVLLLLRSPCPSDQPSYWGVVFDGSTFRTSELQVVPPPNGEGNPSLYYQGNPVIALPTDWIGDLALGFGEQLVDRSILCFSPSVPG